MINQPEFSRLVDVRSIPAGGQRETIAATRSECQALAKRMMLPAIHALKARLDIRPWKGGWRVTGELKADIEQECVRTLENFPVQLKAPVERTYLPSGQAPSQQPQDEPIDPLAADEPDILQGFELDIGELVAETLALSLDPWPKKPGTSHVDYHTGAAEEHEPPRKKPFAALQALKKKP